MVDAKDTRVGTGATARVPIAGYSNPAGASSQDALGVPFLIANDRYQVVVCANSGTSASNPSFRYWYAGGAPWGELIAEDFNAPVFHTVDEDLAPVHASLELPFQSIKTPLEATIDGVLIEFTPQPLILDPSASSVMVGLSAHVEAYGPPDYARAAGAQVTGIVSSQTLSWSELVSLQPSDPWPNTRTLHLPLRINTHVRAARVIFDDLYLVEVNRVSLLGKTLPLRNL